MKKKPSVKAIVDSGQSRALLIQGINEGLVALKGENDFLKSLSIGKNLKNMALTQILTSDETNLTLDGQTCEFEYAGDMIDSGLIKCMATVRAVCSDRANGRKALPYGMRFSCFTNRDLRRR